MPGLSGSGSGLERSLALTVWRSPGQLMFKHLLVLFSDFQSGAPEPGTLASPGNTLEMPNFRPLPMSTESETLGEERP